MLLLVGLGNPGAEYAKHRHNIGFMALDAIAERHKFGPWKRKFQGECADGTIAGVKCLALKPQTFMNESGRSVAEAARFFKIPDAKIIVFYDELDLAPGRFRMKTGGGSAGHNGIRSLMAHLDSDFRRGRMGIGHPGDKALVHNHVLSDFSKAEMKWVGVLCAGIARAVGMAVMGADEKFQAEVMRLAPAVKVDPRKAGRPAGPSDEA
jgi:peptidyl-tRNA hydrolase, PTH1 family